jgi:hypothetical protein
MIFKNKIVLLTVFAVILLFVSRQPGRALEATDALEMLLQSSGASVTEGEVQYLASLDDRFLSMDELEDKLLAAAKILGLKGGETVRSEGKTYRVLDMTGETVPGTSAHIVVQSNPGDTQLGAKPQSYLLVVCRDSSPQRIMTTAARLETALRPLARGGQVSYYLTGELNGKYTAAEMSKMAESALESVNAKVVEGMWEEELVSLTAYTPLITRYYGSGDKRFNLNLAVRYDNHKNRTVLWAGFPLIHTTY